MSDFRERMAIMAGDICDHGPLIYLHSECCLSCHGHGHYRYPNGQMHICDCTPQVGISVAEWDARGRPATIEAYAAAGGDLPDELSNG